jgi:hypothetical protein
LRALSFLKFIVRLEPQTPPPPTPRLPNGLPPHPQHPRIDPGPPQPLKFAAPPE